jgi:hypothetical protein
MFYTSNVQIQDTQLITPTLATFNITTATYLPYTIGLISNIELLTQRTYGNTYVFTSNFSPVFSNTASNFPFYVYVKNSTTSVIPIRVVSGGITYTTSGPAGCNLYPSTSNVTGNSALTILYASSSTQWFLY